MAAEAGRVVRGIRRRTSEERGNIGYMWVVYNGEENKGEEVGSGVVQVALRLEPWLNLGLHITSSVSSTLGHEAQTQRVVNSLNQAGQDRRACRAMDR